MDTKMNGWTKAGLICGAYGIVLELMALLFGGYGGVLCIAIAFLLLYFATGVWATSWTIPLPSVRQSAKIGLYASLISSSILTIFSILLGVLKGLYPKTISGEFVFELFLGYIKLAFVWALLSMAGAFITTALRKDGTNT